MKEKVKDRKNKQTPCNSKRSKNQNTTQRNLLADKRTKTVLKRETRELFEKH